MDGCKNQPKKYGLVAGGRLLKARTDSGYTKEQVGEHIGKSADTVKSYETGQRDISATQLIELSKMYGCTIDYLVGIPNAPRSYNGGLGDSMKYTGLSEKSVERVKQLLILQQSSVGDNLHTMLNLLLESHKLESLLRDLCRFNDAVNEFQDNTAITNSVPVLDRMDENVRFRKYLLTQQFEQLVDSVIHSNDILDKYHENRGRMIEAMFNGANEKEMESNESSKS